MLTGDGDKKQQDQNNAESGKEQGTKAGKQEKKPDIRATKAEKHTLEGSQEQYKSISKAQHKHRKAGKPDKIKSIKKSDQQSKYQLKKIKSSKDAPVEEN